LTKRKIRAVTAAVEIQNLKHEIRNKFECQMTETQNATARGRRCRWQYKRSYAPLHNIPQQVIVRVSVFPISNFEFVLDFGFRVSDFSPCIPHGGQIKNPASTKKPGFQEMEIRKEGELAFRYRLMFPVG
jgi:hypothetical protein